MLRKSGCGFPTPNATSVTCPVHPRPKEKISEKGQKDCKSLINGMTSEIVFHGQDRNIASMNAQQHYFHKKCKDHSN